MALPTRAWSPWSRASVDFVLVMASSSLLTLDTTVATTAEVSVCSFSPASFLRMVSVRERHWLVDSGDDAVR